MRNAVGQQLLCVTTFCSAWAHRRTSQANTCVRRSAPISIVDRTGNVMYTCTLVGLCVNGHLRVANCVFAIIQKCTHKLTCIKFAFIIYLKELMWQVFCCVKVSLWDLRHFRRCRGKFTKCYYFTHLHVHVQIPRRNIMWNWLVASLIEPHLWPNLTEFSHLLRTFLCTSTLAAHCTIYALQWIITPGDQRVRQAA